MKSRPKMIPVNAGSAIIALLILAISCTQPVEQKKPIEGAWKLIFLNYVSDGEVTYEMPGNTSLKQVKMWTENNFAFVGQASLDTTTMNNYGHGTYSFEGSHYVEYIILMNGEFVENTLKMILEISNDTLIQTWPVDENGEIDRDNYQVEKYIRLD